MLATPSDQPVTHLPTILTIDDSPIALIARRFLLERAGYRVLTASCADEAVEIVAQQQVDLVLMDYYLGSGNGAQARGTMKRMRPGMPVLVLSGAADMPEDLANVDLFLSKLDGPEHLLATIARFLPARDSGKAA